MAYQKTRWRDHIVARPRTFIEVKNDDGSVTHNPSIGEVLQQGTPINAINLNNIETGLLHFSVAYDWLCTLILAHMMEDVVASVNGKKGRQVNLTAADVGARPDTWMPTAQEVGALAASGSGALVQTGRVELSVPADGWIQNEQGWYVRMVTCAGTVVGSQTQRVDVAVQGAQIGNVLLAGLRVDANDTLTLVCLAQPAEAFTLLVLLSEVV